jgi:DNA-directed RNA polymerase subunit RPC12/RpoP
LKRLLPTNVLVALDRLFQPTGALWQLAPSVIARCTADAARPAAPPGAFFRCTVCGSTVLVDEGNALSCTACGARFAVQGGIYDFKAPLEESAR